MKKTPINIDEIKSPEYHVTFGLTKKQYDKFIRWKKKKSKGNNYSGTMGGSYYFSFTPTGIGVCVVGHFEGDSIDLTDYNTW